MDKDMVYSHIEMEIAKLQKPAIVGINGSITSGKTMLAHELSRYMQNMGHHTQIIHIDDYHNPRHVRLRDNTPECYFYNAIDTQSFSKLIWDIKRGPVNKTVELLDMGTDTYINNKTYSTNMDTIVIVEGVLLYIQSISHLFDYKIYLDIDYDEVIRRGKERDVPLYGEGILQQYVDLYIPVQKIYVERCSPKEQSDLVIINNNFYKPLIAKSLPFLS